MGSCTRRHFLLSTCFLQLVTIIERQVFDFLGYMWTPILANFFHIIFVIFGFYGAYHFRAKYIITYLIWSFIWIGWNTFLICFYLDIGILNKNSDILNLGTGSVSWFEVNGYGCKPIYPINITSEDPYRPVRPEQVDDCLIDYPIVEVIHSGIQCILSLLAILGAILIAQIFLDEDDRFDFMGGDAKSPQHTSVHPMYVSYSSIPTSASGTLLSNKHNLNIDKMKSNSTQLITTNLNDNSLSKTATIQKTMNTTNKTPRNNINNSNNNNNNNSNNNINNSNIKNSNYSNFINRPDIKYTQISTEQLMVNNPITDLLDDSNDNFSLRTFKIDQTCNTYIPFQKPVPILYLNNDKNLSRNSSTTTTQYLDNRINDINSITEINTINNSNNSNIITNPFLQNENSLKPQQQEMLSNNFKKKHFSQLKHQELLLKKNPPNHFHNNCYYQPYPDLSPEIPEIPENYVMPDQYVTRSPNLNRISSRRRQDKSHITNFCDQIRDAPPGYNDAYMSRAKSHDRLSYRNRRQNYNKNPRPRSYCNNSNNNNNNNNMNGTGLVGVNGICGDDDADYGFATKSSNKKSKQRQSFYSVEFGPPVDTIRGCPENLLDYQDTDGHGGISQLSPKPMTPRRVKRRSVMTRGSNSRQSTQSRRSHSSSRNSVRNSRRKFQQNPVTKLLDQQQQLQLQIQQPQQQQQSKTIKTFASFSHIENPTLTATNLKTLNHDIISNTSIINNNINTKSNYNQFQENLNTDPIYYNTSNSTTQLQQTWVSNNSPIQGNVNPVIIGAGHLNPSYQHSTPNLTNSTEHIDELYNNRPPSVRSSYSNFHGTRPLSSYNTTENVFAGITTQQLNQRHIQQQLQPTSILNPSSSISQPQVPPTRRSASRESVRSMAFLNNGPPAYNLNYHTPPDSETTM